MSADDYSPSWDGSDSDFLIVRHQKTGLVLDASEYEVKLQHFTGFPAQLWKLEIGGPGTFLFINKKNGKALDIECGAEEGHQLITYAKHGRINQQWHVNSDGSIVCPRLNLAVDIFKGKYSAGNEIIAWTKHGGENQKFYLQSK